MPLGQVPWTHVLVQPPILGGALQQQSPRTVEQRDDPRCFPAVWVMIVRSVTTEPRLSVTADWVGPAEHRERPPAAPPRSLDHQRTFTERHESVLR